VRIRRGTDPDLIVRLADGYHAAIAMSWTDYAAPPTELDVADSEPLLAVDGLRQMADLVAHLRRGPGGPDERTLAEGR
jgi:hypothetical protein